MGIVETNVFAPPGSVTGTNVIAPNGARLPNDGSSSISDAAGTFTLSLSGSYYVAERPLDTEFWGYRLNRVDYLAQVAQASFGGWSSAALNGQTVTIPSPGVGDVTYDPVYYETPYSYHQRGSSIYVSASFQGSTTAANAAFVNGIWWRLTLDEVWEKRPSDSAAIGLNETVAISVINVVDISLSDTATVGLGESTQRAIGIATTDTATVGLAEAPAVTAQVTMAESVTLAGDAAIEAAPMTTQSVSDSATLADAVTISAGPASPQWVSRPLRALLTTAAGASVSVPVLSGRYRLELGRIGEMELEVQAERLPADPVVTAALFRQGEGLVCQGVVLTIDRRAGQRGEVLCTLRCATMGRELALRPVVRYSATAASLSSVVDALLAGTGWTRGSVPTATVTVTVTGASRWQALADIADRLGCELREDPLQRRVDIVPRSTFPPSGWAAITGPALDRADHDPPVLPILELTASWDASELVTRVIPYAEPEGGRQARIENTTRTSPYTVQSATAEDGSTYYYLQDAAAAAVWGVRPQVVTWKGIAPQDDTTAESQRAANELYDAAVAWLQARREPRMQLDVVTGSADHVDGQTGAYRIQVGQSLRVRARLAVPGVATTLDIDQELAVTSIERQFEASGVDRWRLGVSTIARPAPDDVEALSAAIAALSGGTTVGTAPAGGGAGGGGGGGLTRTLWDTLIEASLSGQLGTPWW